MNRRFKILFLMLFALTISVGAVAQRQYRSARTVVRGGMIERPDTAKIAKGDSLPVTDSLVSVADSLRGQFADSLAVVGADSLITVVPQTDTLRRDIENADSLASVVVRKPRLRADGTVRQPLISDSMGISRVCWASLVLPGFGQIYNKQYWKLPFLYTSFGATLGMFIYEDNRYRPLKREFDEVTSVSLSRTQYLDELQDKMMRINTARQIFMYAAIGSYIYFIGDAAVNYATNDVSDIKKATTLAMICPGAGQIYNKSYWRVPIVLGAFATTIYCVDWNNRGYQRFKKAYRLRAAYDATPENYPNGSADEFKGNYPAEFLKNLKNSYRRNRDLCIILTGGMYVLQIVDAHVDAHLRDYDISDDLSMELTPLVDYNYNPAMGRGGAVFGMGLTLKF